jgi:hypothetical protein
MVNNLTFFTISIDFSQLLLFGLVKGVILLRSGGLEN